MKKLACIVSALSLFASVGVGAATAVVEAPICTYSDQLGQFYTCTVALINGGVIKSILVDTVDVTPYCNIASATGTSCFTCQHSGCVVPPGKNMGDAPFNSITINGTRYRLPTPPPPSTQTIRALRIVKGKIT